jgi:hypothetical protein
MALASGARATSFLAIATTGTLTRPVGHPLPAGEGVWTSPNISLSPWERAGVRVLSENGTAPPSAPLAAALPSDIAQISGLR